MHITLVVAAAENGVIGRDGGLPWRMPSDLRQFRRLTLGKPVIMGRRTFESIGRPLDGRDNIVVTRDPAFRPPSGVTVVRSFEAALEAARRMARARGADEIAVIGGGEIYRAALPVADRIHLTRIHARPAGDTFFSDPDPALWHVTASASLAPDPRDSHAATTMTYARR